MEKIVEQGLLYDFYGELLTDHQRNVYEDVVFNDLSPSEIAKEQGISRQGVHDLIRRCNKILEEYEAKLHLVARWWERSRARRTNTWRRGIWNGSSRFAGSRARSPAPYRCMAGG